MGITQILFWGLSILALLGAILVVISKNPVHSVLWLIVVFVAISGHYILLNAQFLAIVNLIVYAGAIMVLFLFVFMLMNLNADTEPQKNKWLKIAGVVAGGSLLLVLVRTIAMFELSFLAAGPTSQTLVVVLYYSVFASGVRAIQSIDAMAVIYMITTLVWLLLALRFVNPTQIVARVKQQQAT